MVQPDEPLLRAIFDGARDAMLVDDGVRYLDANPAACALFGIARDALIGRPAGELVPLRRADGRERVLERTGIANVVPGCHLTVLRDVTERSDADEAMRRSEALFRAVIENSTEAISLTGGDGATHYMTPSTARLLGWTDAEMATMNMRDQVIPEDRPRIAAELERLVRTGARSMSLEFRVQHRDGSILWIESTGTNMLADPDVRAVVGNYRDVTARKHAEQAVRESRDLLEEAQAIARVGSWTSSMDMRGTVAWSPECYRIYGLPLGSTVTVESALGCVHPDDRARVMKASQDAVEHDIPADLEHRVIRGDGSVGWVHARAAVERDEAGRPTRLIGSAQDITVRHAAATALRVSEERYRRIVENTSEGVWMYDAAGTTTFVNTRMAEMLGCTVAEMIGRPLFSFMDDEQVAVARARIDRRRRGITERSDFKLRRESGEDLWVSIHANPLVDADGRFESLALVSDISARRRADEARARLAAIVESSEDAILSTSPEGMITSWNFGAEKLYGYSAEEMVGQSVLRIAPSAMLAVEAQLLARAVRGEASLQHETRRVRKDGTVLEVALTMSPIRDAAGTVVGVSHIGRDLTVRRQNEEALRRTEEQLRQVQKMEAVGRLAGGVAHDFNNLLSVILSYTGLAIDDLRPGDPLRGDLEEIQRAGERATELTRQLLAFSRQQVLQPRVIELGQIVAGLQSMLARLLGEDIELTVLGPKGGDRVLADPGQIEQVVMNLAVNARDAMPDGGKLTIETTSIQLDGRYLADHLGIAAGDYVVLAMSDTGTGMDTATRTRIFEPFFTTKPVGKGTGLGLSTVFGIAEQSGGHVGVTSEPGRGSTFRVYLPRTERDVDAAVLASASAVLRGTETILLVEDEEQVRVVACAILRRNGYHVLDASNGGEAFLISRDYSERIDLLLSDVVMPRMSGHKLAEHLAPQRPDMKVLFASGYTDDATFRHGVLGEGVAFLQKPFTPDALLRRVREVLDAPTSTGRPSA